VETMLINYQIEDRTLEYEKKVDELERSGKDIEN
jgi:hypothetical protein